MQEDGLLKFELNVGFEIPKLERLAMNSFEQFLTMVLC